MAITKRDLLAKTNVLTNQAVLYKSLIEKELGLVELASNKKGHELVGGVFQICLVRCNYSGQGKPRFVQSFT